MGKLQSFKIDGLDLFFNSNDHRPEHFHVRKSGAWEIRVYFLLCSKGKELVCDIKYPPSAQLTSKEKNKILKLVLENKSKLLIEWKQKVCIQEDR